MSKIEELVQEFAVSPSAVKITIDPTKRKEIKRIDIDALNRSMEPVIRQNRREYGLSEKEM